MMLNSVDSTDSQIEFLVPVLRTLQRVESEQRKIKRVPPRPCKARIDPRPVIRVLAASDHPHLPTVLDRRRSAARYEHVSSGENQILSNQSSGTE
jgi:hypothetical protein